MLVARRAALRAALAVALATRTPTLDFVQPAAALDAGLGLAEGNGWAIGVPPTYYAPRSRPKAGTYDDTVFVAADYAAGRTVSVSRTACESLLNDAGDPLPLVAGPITSLRDVGKPQSVASMLTRRRDGDPRGTQQARSEVRDVVKISDNEILFTVLTLTTVPTSMTTAMPAARRTLARTIFDPTSGSLLTAWATSAAPRAACEVVECPECTGLRCECPPPKCTLPEGGMDELDSAVIRSFGAR